MVGNAAAASAGVVPGLRLASALGLMPGLTLLERDLAREAKTLQGLACWAGQFTPQLSLAEPFLLLLDIGASLRLFGGLQFLRTTVLQTCREQGFSVSAAVAPTPLGASWLAQAGEDVSCLDEASLHVALALLTPQVTGWPAAILERLQSFGLERLGDLSALPRAALAQRLGRAVVTDLARAWGEAPDPRPAFRFPEKFSQRLEFPSPVEVAEGLLFAARRLLAALVGWLTVRAAGVRALFLEMEHDNRSLSVLELRMAEVTRDESRFSRVLRDRLAGFKLGSAVQAMRLRVDDLLLLPGENGLLFDGGEKITETAIVGLERLQARLGDERVYALRCLPDYRPECATLPVGLDGMSENIACQAQARPFWLLPEPDLLPEVQGRPVCQGVLSLLQGPERIESGWWDEGEKQAVGDVRRNYFIAEDVRGRLLWIFRSSNGWYLHGIFG